MIKFEEITREVVGSFLSTTITLKPDQEVPLQSFGEGRRKTKSATFVLEGELHVKNDGAKNPLNIFTKESGRVGGGLTQGGDLIFSSGETIMTMLCVSVERSLFNSLADVEVVLLENGSGLTLPEGVECFVIGKATEGSDVYINTRLEGVKSVVSRGDCRIILCREDGL